MNQKLAFCSVVGSFYALLLSCASEASITYSVKPYNISPGYSIDGGFIQISNLGTLGVDASFEDFSYEVTTIGMPQILSQTAGFQIGYFNDTAYYPLVATPTSLLITNPNNLDPNMDTFLSVFKSFSSSTIVYIEYHSYSDAVSINGAPIFSWQQGDSFIIGTRPDGDIPEPLSIFVWSGLFLGCVGFGLVRRKLSA